MVLRRQSGQGKKHNACFRKSLLHLSGVIVVVLLLAGYEAQMRPSATPSATAAETEGGLTWDYVALGDSIAQGHSYVAYYAAHIEADLGVKVRLQNKCVSGQNSLGLLLALRNDQSLRDALSEAEVVTFVIGANDIKSLVYCSELETEGGNCQGVYQEALTSFRANYDAIIAEILTLRSTDNTIIRAMDYHNPFVKRLKERGTYEDVKPYLGDAFSEHIAEAASEHNIPVARVYLAMNGPNGDEDPGDKGYLAGDGYFSDAGHRLVAEIHRELGYKPLAP